MVRVATGGGGKTSKASSNKVPSYVPSKYRSDVATASRKTGIPAAVVAAQIREESGFNPGAVSPTGAEGIAQFEPGTWSSWGHGSPFNAGDAFNAYAAYMSSLLKQEHGNLRDALAAYNAGPGDIQAGMGYANTILKAAGESGGSFIASVGGSSGKSGSGGSGGLFSWPSSILDTFTSFGQAIDWFLQPNHWVRIFAGVGGGIALVAGMIDLSLVGRSPNIPMVGTVSTGQATLPMGILLVGVGGIGLFVAFHNLPSNVDSLPALLGYLQGQIQGAAA